MSTGSNNNKPTHRPTFSAFDGKTDLERMEAIENSVNLDKFKDLSPTERIKLAEATCAKLMKFYEERGTLFCGFQANLSENYSERLSPLLDLHLNNIGDPFADVGGYRLNSKAAERAILKHFSTLWVGEPTSDFSIPQPCGIRNLSYAPDTMDQQFFASAIGYVCSFGSTEGNLWALRQARDYLKGKFLFSKLYGDLNSPATNEGALFGPLSQEQQQRQQSQPPEKAFGGHDRDAIAVHFKREDKYHPSAALVPTALADGDRTSLNLTEGGLLSPFMSPHVSAVGIEGVLMSPRLEGLISPQPVPRSLLPVSTSIGLKPFLPKQVNGVNISFNGHSFRQPIILYSEASHYSISKIKDLLEIHTPATFMTAFYNNNWQRPDVVIKPTDCFAILQKRYAKRSKLSSPSSLSSSQSPLGLELAVDDFHYHKDPDADLTPENWMKIFGRDEFPNTLPIYEDGTMNLEALHFLTRFFFAMGNPVIVVANLGTTFSGCHDDPIQITNVIKHTPGCHVEGSEQIQIDGVDYTKISRRNYYIHVDGALGASYVPFWEQHTKENTIAKLGELFTKYENDPQVQPYLYRLKVQGEILTAIKNGTYNYDGGASHQYHPPTRHAAAVVVPPTTLSDAMKNQQVDMTTIVLPTFTFRKSPVMSIAMSGHKFIGGPAPSGVAMTLRKYQLDFLTSGITYISSPDTTISGSRSGLNVNVMYDYLSRHSPEMEMAKYFVTYNSARFVSKLLAHSIKSTFLSVARDKPNKYHMPLLDKFLIDEEQGQYAQEQQQDQEQQPLPQTPLVFNFTGALSVIFPQPLYDVQDKYSLSLDVVRLPRKYGYNWSEDYLKTSPILSFCPRTDSYIMRAAHIFTMDSVQTAVLQELCWDLGQDQQIQDLIAAQIPPQQQDGSESTNGRVIV